jgi:hypothetical protein
MNLLHLQKQKGDGHLFVVSFPGWEDVPFKLPSVRRSQQYSAMMALADNTFSIVTLYEQIFRECVVDENLAFHREDIPAGIVESTARLILLLSGLNENAVEYTKGLYQTYRSQATMPLVFMKRVICSAFGAYTFEYLDGLDYQTICEVFVQAERLMLDGGILEEEYELLRPEEQPRKKMANADEFVSDAPDGVPGKGPRPTRSPAVQEAMREARMTALREARAKAAREQAERTKNKR